jgi:hypothetical protein
LKLLTFGGESRLVFHEFLQALVLVKAAFSLT